MCPSRAHITSEYHNRHRDYQCPLDWKFRRNRGTRLSLRRDIMIYDGVTWWDDDEILCSFKHHLMIVSSLYNPRMNRLLMGETSYLWALFLLRSQLGLARFRRNELRIDIEDYTNAVIYIRQNAMIDDSFIRRNMYVFVSTSSFTLNKIE